MRQFLKEKTRANSELASASSSLTLGSFEFDRVSMRLTCRLEFGSSSFASRTTPAGPSQEDRQGQEVSAQYWAAAPVRTGKEHSSN
jgi:hypothetical protein